MSQDAVKFPIGKSDFAAVREGKYEYVDKSLFISDILKDSAEVLLFPRPRRFGKTLNLSMLKYFFEKSQENRRELFSGLQIEKKTEAWEHFQKYPVLFLTLKDVKTNTWEDAFQVLKEIIAKLYEDHRYLLGSSLLSKEQKEGYQHILSKTAEPAQYFRSLLDLSVYVAKYHQEKVLILIDEYDTCIHGAYLKGYYDKAIEFFKNFMSGGLKDNPHLFKAVITGILRVARESLFSGLNNLAVYSLLKPEFATFFGFTEIEVSQLVNKVGHPELLQNIKAWYNGYLFGKKHEIYNPWSILSFLKSEDKKFEPYWVNTASNELIRKMLFSSSEPIRKELETLLQGGTITKPIEENITLREVEINPQALWSFLLFSGYLTAESLFDENDRPYAILRLVNREVRAEFSQMAQSWFEEELGHSYQVEQIIKALFSGEVELLEDALGHLMKVMLSYIDVPNLKDKEQIQAKKGSRTPESVYHAFILGLLAHISSKYEVRSNPESGFGRADTLIFPKVPGKPGVVLEYKVVRKQQTPEEALQDALNQIEKKAYKSQLLERGANPILEYAIAFLGKQAFVKLRNQSF